MERISTAEAAAIAGVKESIIKTHAREGRFAASKWGRSWMIDRESFEAYLRTKRPPGQPKKI